MARASGAMATTVKAAMDCPARKFIAPPASLQKDIGPRARRTGSSPPGAGREAEICDEARLLEAILRTDPASFTAKVFHTVNPTARYLDNWHVQLICEYLAACSTGEIRRLIINLPPRSLKSICVSVAWPAWLMGHRPSARIMTASYNRDLSVRHALDFRTVISSPWYRWLFPGFVTAPDQNEKHKLQTTARGHRIATSVGGAATGEGADILIVDDPHNPRQALSTVQRESALDWFDQTFASRLDDKKKGVMVVVMQRLHERDLTGHLLAKGGWEHLCLPAEAERRTVIDFGTVKLTRAPGDLLHPEREGPVEIARAKRDLGAYAYAAQYQQRPAPLAGGIVDPAWFKRYGALPANPLRIVQSWDTAFKGGALNDPSVCGTWAETETGYYLLHVARRRLE